MKYIYLLLILALFGLRQETLAKAKLFLIMESKNFNIDLS